MLLLSGLRDEVVPKEHMTSLWEIVDKRQGANAKDLEGGLPKKGEGQVGEGKSKLVTFERGSHSMFRTVRSGIRLINFGTDDTCVQEGYWPTVAEFVSSLGDSAGASQL